MMAARVVSVYDGDTFKADVAAWPDVTVRVSIRVAGVDTPEIRGRCPAERKGAIVARDFVRRIIGKRVTLHDVRKGKYASRVVARVILADGRDLATVLIAAGLGRPYDGGRRQGWCG